jgi:hypothetical protein
VFLLNLWQATWPWVPIVEVCRIFNGSFIILLFLIEKDQGQAQYIRIPYADFNALKLPPGKEHESDFILLAGMCLCNFLAVHIAYSNQSKTDVFPTGMLPSPLCGTHRGGLVI